MFSFVDPRYDLEVEYADSGFCEEYPSEWECYFDWIPPLNRKRRPAGDGTFCSSSNSLKEEYKDPLSIQSEPQLPRPSTSTPSPSVPISSTSRSASSLPPSAPGTEPLGAYLLRRFLDGSGASAVKQPGASQVE